MVLEMQEGHFVSEIRNFLEFHDLVIIIFCFLSQSLRKNHYNVGIWVLKVENSRDLCI